MAQIRLALLIIVAFAAPAVSASAWNIPSHMLSGAIAYQVLQQESPQTIDKVQAVLQKHPWYPNQWQARLQDVLVANHRALVTNLELTPEALWRLYCDRAFQELLLREFMARSARGSVREGTCRTGNCQSAIPVD